MNVSIWGQTSDLISTGDRILWTVFLATCIRRSLCIKRSLSLSLRVTAWYWFDCTCHLRQNVGLGEGRWADSPDWPCRSVYREVKHQVYGKRQTRICNTWLSFPFTYRLLFISSTHKLVASRNFLSIRIVLSCFYLLIFYFEKFSTCIWRLPFTVYVKLKLPTKSPGPGGQRFLPKNPTKNKTSGHPHRKSKGKWNQYNFLDVQFPNCRLKVMGL